ncbi:MAG: RIP metalloprotease RseP [Eubacteriales bacterium]|nr:RIP metalloprotease RseP [Eubacteriales bacterium]MDY3332989.1 RIP metalloprotease RseP [Gallibacter sp.]
MTIIYAILMLAILIFIHELGHFMAAKACGVKVNEFALGMGPVLFKRVKGETQYSLRAIPIGGFCAMEGEDEVSDDDRAFNKKKPWQKLVIVAAGAFMNLVAAILIMIIVVYSTGTAVNKVGEVVKDSPAQQIGIQVGDELISVNGNAIKEWDDFTTNINKIDPTKEVKIGIKRGDEEKVFSTMLTKENGRYLVGVIAAKERHPGRALIDGPKQTWTMTKMMYSTLSGLFTGEIAVKDLSGPVGIVYMVGESAANGFITFLYFMALISLNLAIVNMLPFPALDGGRAVFIIINKITGKPISEKTEGIIHTVGLLLLFALMIYATWNDIIRFIAPLFS